MDLKYQRTQPGFAMMIAILIVLAIEALVSLGRPFSIASIAVALFLFALGLIFSSMTIAISEENLEWWFAFGAFRQKLPLNQIVIAVSDRVTFLNGLGIRTNGRDWLWIVNGATVIRLDLRDGRTISLGTAEPQELALLIDGILSNTR